MSLVATYIFFSYFAILLSLYGLSNRLVRGNTRVIFYLISFALLNGLRLLGQDIFDDIPNYREIYYSVDLLWNSPFYDTSNLLGLTTDVGYIFVNAVFRSLGFSYEVYLLVIFAVQTAIFYRFSKAFGLEPVVSFTIYIAIFMMTFQIGMLRQALAFCFFLIALEFLDRKRIFAALIIVGATFHLSTLFCLLMIWSDRKVSVYWFYLSFLVSIIIYLMRINVLELLIPSIEFFDALRRVLFYLEVDRVNNFLGIGFWEKVILFIAICAIRVDLVKTNRLTAHLNIVFNIAVLSIIFQLLMAEEPTIVSRLRLYAQIFPLLFIGHYIFTLLRGHIFWCYRIPFIVYLSWYFSFQTSYFLP